MKIQISCETSGASIYYTLDGSTPTKDKSLYTNELELSESCTVKAVGIKEGFRDSEITEQNFEVLQKLPTPDIKQYTSSGYKNWFIILNNKNDYIEYSSSNLIFHIDDNNGFYNSTVDWSTAQAYLIDTVGIPEIGNEVSCYATADNYIQSDTHTIVLKASQDCPILY